MAGNSISEPRLDPLAYHHALVGHLKSHEPDVWAWASSQRTRDEHVAQLRTDLLRDTYRIERDAHSDVHASLELAMQRLGVTAPAFLYQAAGQAMNASLVFVPGEVHVVLHGQLLERLSEAECLAVFGHELAHFILWSHDDGDFLVADRILNDALASPQATASHHESSRRYCLHTELFADRGGALAAGSIGPVISTLVKLHTGITNPDPAAYLRQAAEIDAREPKASGGVTHPETFIRARALELWWQGAENLEAWVSEKLRGASSLDTLDLPDQVHLQEMVRGFLAYFLADTGLRAEPVLNQVRGMFPDWAADEAPVTPRAFREWGADDAVLNLLNALMLDLALVDPDTQEAALVRACIVARELGSEPALQASLRRDAGLGKREMEKLKKTLDQAEAR